MIHEVRGNFVISSHGVWMPGSYESKRAARYAFRFRNEELKKLQDAANARVGGAGGTITLEDLKAMRRAT